MTPLAHVLGALRSSLSPRAYWSILDQGISSVSSFVLLVAVARASDVSTVGKFLLAYLLYGFVLGAGRAIGGDVLLLRAAERPDEIQFDCRRLLGLACALGGVAAIAFGLLAALAGADALGTSLLCLGIALVPVLVQDALRYCLFAQGRPSLAAANDTIWLALQVALTAALVVLWDASSPAQFVFAWGAGALVAGGIGIWQTGLLPTGRDLRRWFTEDTGRVSSFFTDFSLMIAATHVSVYLIAVIATVEDVAAFRGMMLLFSPLDALFAGIRIMTLPALVRAIRPGGAEVRKLAYLVSLASAAVTAAWALVIISLPDRAGRAVLGATWEVAEPLEIAIAVASAALFAALPLQAGLRALRSARRLVILRVIQTALLFCGVVVGTWLDAAQGAAAGLAIASAVGALIWWHGFSRSSHLVLAPLAPVPRAGSAAGASAQALRTRNDR